MTCGEKIFAAILVVACIAASPCAIADTLPRGVLIINESSPTSPFSGRFTEKIHSVLDNETAQDFAIYSEFLDVGHFAGSDYDATMYRYFHDKYRNIPIEVIVSVGSRALEFVLRMRKGLWFDVPIVATTFDSSPPAIHDLPPNTFIVSVLRRFQDLVTSAKLLVPNLSGIVLVGEALERQPLRRNYQQEVQQLKKELNLIDLTGLPLSEIKKPLAALPRDVAIVYLPIYTDDKGVSHNPAEALKKIVEAANRPIVVDSEDFIGKGAAGGLVLAAEDLGNEAGHRIALVLNEQGISNIPNLTKSFNKPIFDARKLKQWGVDEASLPAGSEVRFREFSAWELYRWQIIAVCIVIPAQSFMIGLLMHERRRRHLAERESHQHLLEVTKMDRAMTVSAMSASIAHELNQPLGAILNNAEAAEMLLDANSPDINQVKEILEDIRHDDLRAAEIIKRLRVLLKHGEIDAVDFNYGELITETTALVKRLAEDRGVTIKVESLPSRLIVRADSVHIQQVLLNLIMNAFDAMENSPQGKRELKLRVTRNDGQIMVSIQDTGPGIPEDKLKSIFEPFITTKAQGTGLGLSIARTIVGAYGGNIWAENVADGGAVFYFTLNATSGTAKINEAVDGSRVQ